MAESTRVQLSGFDSVEIYDKTCLGTGSYGKVYKARFGQLPCAAKLFHDAIFCPNDKGAKYFPKEFERECKFLTGIKHPHIIQYLSIVQDSQTGNLAILMELMDENLTDFLQKSKEPLSLYNQLKICYDVALALQHLHSNDIMHGNLTSKNVLLTGCSTVKVADYGIMKLMNMVNPQHSSSSTLSSAVSPYMPPEVLTTPPQITKMLDCFSYGVLVTQIITKQAPNPGPSSTFLEDSRYPTGRILALVPEVDRRKTDIQLIGENHPLLPIVLNCLKDRDVERLTVEELCRDLAVLIKREQKQAGHTYENQTKVAKPVELSEYEISSFQAKLGELLHKINEKDEEIASKLAIIREEEAVIREKIARIEKLEKMLEVKDKIIYSLEQKLKVQQHEYASPKKTSPPKSKTSPPKSKTLPPMSKPQPPLPPSVPWKTGQPAPRSLSAHRGSVVVHENRAYFSLMKTIYTYCPGTNNWITLPDCTQSCFALAFVDDHLVAIGGYIEDTEITNKLVGITPAKSWEDILPPMPTKRANPAAATTSTHLIVAGGKISPLFVMEGGLNVIEVLEFYSHQWTSVSSLPIAIDYPQLVLCNEHLYASGVNHRTVFMCCSEELVRSSPARQQSPPPPAGLKCSPPAREKSPPPAGVKCLPTRPKSPLPARQKSPPPARPKCPPPVPTKPTTQTSAKQPTMGGKPKVPLRVPLEKTEKSTKKPAENVWKRIADFPLSRGVTTTAMGDKILAIGGHDDEHHPNGIISCYDRSNDSWRLVSELSTPRWGALAAVLPNGKMLVIGGNASISESCDTTDVGKLNLSK